MLFFLVSELSQNPLTFFDRLDKLGFRVQDEVGLVCAARLFPVQYNCDTNRRSQEVNDAQ
jgi:hypothetical protein